jgi:hypothetical protein
MSLSEVFYLKSFIKTGRKSSFGLLTNAGERDQYGVLCRGFNYHNGINTEPNQKTLILAQFISTGNLDANYRQRMYIYGCLTPGDNQFIIYDIIKRIIHYYSGSVGFKTIDGGAIVELAKGDTVHSSCISNTMHITLSKEVDIQGKKEHRSMWHFGRKPAQADNVYWIDSWWLAQPSHWQGANPKKFKVKIAWLISLQNLYHDIRESGVNSQARCGIDNGPVKIRTQENFSDEFKESGYARNAQGSGSVGVAGSPYNTSEYLDQVQIINIRMRILLIIHRLIGRDYINNSGLPADLLNADFDVANYSAFKNKLTGFLKEDIDLVKDEPVDLIRNSYRYLGAESFPGARSFFNVIKEVGLLDNDRVRTQLQAFINGNINLTKYTWGLLYKDPTFFNRAGDDPSPLNWPHQPPLGDDVTMY